MTILKNNNGQGLIEYLIVLALMAVASITVMRVVSQNTSASFAKVSKALGGGTEGNTTIQFEKINAADLKKKDMSNFSNGASLHGNSK